MIVYLKKLLKCLLIEKNMLQFIPKMGGGVCKYDVYSGVFSMLIFNDKCRLYYNTITINWIVKAINLFN